MRGAARPRRGARVAVLGVTTLAVGLLPLAAGATTPAPSGSATPSASSAPTASSTAPAPATRSASAPASVSGPVLPSGPTVPTAVRTGPPPGGPAGVGAKPGATTPSRPKAAGAVPCPPAPTGRMDPSRFNPHPPDGSQYPVSPPYVTCAYVVGYSDVRKLGGAMIVNDPSKTPKLTALGVGARVVFQPDIGYFEIGTIGTLSLPDSDSTFLTFGFTPTTAKVHFGVDSPLTIDGIQQTAADPVVATVSYYMHLQLYDVRVNGVPLDVGGDCHTTRFHVVLTGSSATGYDMYAGGRLTGTIDIPGFTGCVSRGQDLDPLFSAAISGPGNYLDMVQSGLCQNTANCADDSDGLTPLLPPALPTY
jgi:hypothetical protein